jgi:hypothetical protein
VLAAVAGFHHDVASDFGTSNPAAARIGGVRHNDVTI